MIFYPYKRLQHETHQRRAWLIANADWRTAYGVGYRDEPFAPRFYGIPCKAWPWWAKVLRRLRDGWHWDDNPAKDAGVGDTIHRLLGPFGELWQLAFGKRCGCSSRRSRWNALYRYGGCCRG